MTNTTASRQTVKPAEAVTYSPIDSKLMEAARNGLEIACRYFIKEGANTNARNNYAINWSARNGHKAVCQLLIEHGASITAQNSYALRWAARNGHKAVCRLLIKHGADVHAEGGYALRWATKNGHKAVCQLLIEHGADTQVEYIDDDPPKNELRIPIAHAWMFVEPVIQQGTTTALQILVDAGLDVHAALSNKLTPLVMAVKRNDETPSHDMVEILMKAGSEPSEAIKIAAMAPNQDMALLRLLTAEY